MIGKILVGLGGIAAGVLIGYIILVRPEFGTKTSIKILPFTSSTPIPTPFIPPKKQIVGFLPFWLLDKASNDYSKYITTLSYFGLTIDKDGTILKYTSLVEGEPGWFALKQGSLDSFFKTSKEKGVSLSLVVFDGDEKSINELLKDPVAHAKNLVSDVTPVMQQYEFSDLNLDVESVNDASPEARLAFAQFVGEVKKGMDANRLGTLTVDISPIAFVKDTNLVDPKAIASYVDYILLMAYDFHNPGSFVTGPVAPLTGAGTVSEFDTESAVEKALDMMHPQKLILGIPLYGYEWESINNIPRSATIPGSSVIISSQRVEDFLQSCANCESGFDNVAQEAYTIYKDKDTGTYHQIFYPNSASTQIKTSYAQNNNLGGMALWALGYEGDSILSPLEGYKRSIPKR